ncbi:MAG: ECF-type sigma factor [Terriglobia bacterium]
MAATPENVTQLLQSWGQGQREALDKLVPLVYAELHRLAQVYMRGERDGHVLQTTALVNEAFLRLINWKDVTWQNRAHFFGVSAQLMRRILVDFARSRDARRARAASGVSLDEILSPGELSTDVVAVDEALKSLAGVGPKERKNS